MIKWTYKFWKGKWIYGAILWDKREEAVEAVKELREMINRKIHIIRRDYTEQQETIL